MHTRVVVGACAAALLAACHDPEPELQRTSTAPPVVATPAPPPADFALGPGLEMRRPIRDGHLTIIPIAATAPTAESGVLALDDAMDQRVVTVRDLGDYEHVRIRNKSDHPVFAMAGELIYGGEQDHAIADSTIIAPRTSEVVRVYCVEQGRSAGTRWFGPGHALVDTTLRRVMRHGNQSTVWNQVAATNHRLGLDPPTGTYRGAAAQQEAAGPAARVHELERALTDPRLVGLAVAYDGEVVALDRFVSEHDFYTHEHELLASYVAGDDGARHEAAPLDPAAVRRFANQTNLLIANDVMTEVLAWPPAPN